MTRDELIEAYQYLVPVTRRRCYPQPPARIDAADLEGEGYIGLVKAADRYDPARGTAFRTLAIAWIRGAMRDYLRQEDWLPRAERDRLEREGEAPLLLISLDEILISPDLELERRLVETLADPAPTPEAALMEREEEEWFSHMVRWLPTRERQVIHLDVIENLPLAETAAAVGVSPTRIQQLRRQALARLSRFLNR